ncbi:MAG: hypothetical protein IH840_02930 [Candidatus Heimdallarchaeota archaeon]|nr:hypothetical protein [Candidatus Heimdallarchaeota archaeon]
MVSNLAYTDYFRLGLSDIQYFYTRQLFQNYRMQKFDFYFTVVEYRKIKQLVNKIGGFENISQDEKIHLFYNLVFLEVISRRIEIPIMGVIGPGNNRIGLKEITASKNPWFD